jgi:galactokinase/mevalonate kinase-like predicted kinase
LIVTAAGDRQARACEEQLRLRRELGLLAGVRDVLVVPDPGGRRVGSGGSTLCCLARMIREHPKGSGKDVRDPEAWQEALGGLRVLIVHAGGDSKRAPAYGPCGKVFVPVPGESTSAVPTTLFDRQLPTYLALPPPENGQGQVVITSGDVLLDFDPWAVRFAGEGVTGLGCHATPEAAAKHGVYCTNGDGEVRRFLQKPSLAEQDQRGAVDRYGRSILDIGVISFDAATAARLLALFGVGPDGSGGLAWSGQMGEELEAHGLDFYREICCAMGSETTAADYVSAVRAAGSKWSDALLARIFQGLSGTPFKVQVVPRCTFLHFGTTQEIISSGLDLQRQDQGMSRLDGHLSINNEMLSGARIVGPNAWVEGCRCRASLTLGGKNVVVGADIDEPLALPPEACFDVIQGRDRAGRTVWFARCYGVRDTFKDTVEQGATFCGKPVLEWLRAAGAKPADVWDKALSESERTLWDARVFPAEASAAGCRRWLWMFDPAGASEGQREAWRSADRYSLAQIAELADQEAFHDRRARIRAGEIRRSLRRMFRNESGFSAAELAYVLAHADDRAGWAADLLAEAHWHLGNGDAVQGSEFFVFSRILHTLGSAAARLATAGDSRLEEVLPGLPDALPSAERAWLETLGLLPKTDTNAREWADRARAVAFDHLGRRIVSSGDRKSRPPTSALRSDEIVWGRAPARLDVGGGWSDTPPYSLEHGGCVINAAVNLNGQPPIQVYARVIDEPVIRIGSIDLGTRIEVTELNDLLDYRSATSEYGLAKAALALSGFSPKRAAWPRGITLRQMLEQFGGGIELTTLAAIPKGSGLGTSSIMGAVILAVIQRVMGRTLAPRELFHRVLRLEQELTTGGGWQDQIGGVVGGVKVITTAPGLVPDPCIHYVPADVLDPKANGGQTLLYYTGVTRLAKNILQQVVGRYLDRDRTAMATLRQIHGLPAHVSDALARKDVAAFGELVGAAWRQNKELDPGATNEEIERLLARVGPHVHGAKLLGAGGGGFLLMVCRSPEDAAAVRRMLEAEPPNDRARFFDFDVSREGLVVTVC